MHEFHIVVCMKVVPKAEEIRVDPESLLLDRENARSEINPPDMNAIEHALRIKDQCRARVSILSMGPPLFESILRVGLAMGADDFYLLSDRAFAGADTLATTYTLARGIDKIGDVDLVICGEESADGATGQVPAGIAEWLGWPQVTLATEFQLSDDYTVCTARREIPGGYEVHRVKLPAVFSVKTASNEPRFMDFDRKPWAMEEAGVIVWSRSDIEVEDDLIGLKGSPTIVSGLEQAETRARQQHMLEGDPESIAAQLAEILAPFHTRN
ncbi:MAG: electron transfer flavoprotein subunit beta/FixA family protein [Anaerolineales bacterium]|nr:electron transfer flavoprotein subunit beta/FixA family protein [Anaerolineales bacterium]